ncbi:hypothetical protein DFJ67_6360 [Asanoa ferruginea]|uniref:Uncharacterized protein n=1 Tax=Asanoa ferruginea TaxID=53367 RepID=A0A3D9ZSC8_9ACTN|nr:hypothetical protein DFJ67_6360 [Asanoa ferruginea]
MRDRTASRNYSPAGEEFRRKHQRHRAWGLTRRHAERLRRIRGADCDLRTPTATEYHPVPSSPPVVSLSPPPIRAVEPDREPRRSRTSSALAQHREHDLPTRAAGKCVLAVGREGVDRAGVRCAVAAGGKLTEGRIGGRDRLIRPAGNGVLAVGRGGVDRMGVRCALADGVKHAEVPSKAAADQFGRPAKGVSRPAAKASIRPTKMDPRAERRMRRHCQQRSTEIPNQIGLRRPASGVRRLARRAQRARASRALRPPRASALRAPSALRGPPRFARLRASRAFALRAPHPRGPPHLRGPRRCG